ncbi:MAG: glutathione S-transferase [Kiritimatiellia bacterium]|jgi:glutathione S-transferase
MITLHYLNDSRAHRILWMLEEIKAPYEVKEWSRNLKTNLAPREFKQVHPLGKFPVIEDGDLTLAESGAIVHYLAERYGEGMVPEDPATRAQYHYWMHYAEGSLMPPLLMAYVFQMVSRKAPWPVRPLAMVGPNAISKAYLNPNIRTHMTYVNEHLADHEYFVGDEFSGADIQMSFPLEASAGRVDGDYEHVLSYVRRMQARPAYQRALGAVQTPYVYVATVG